MPLFFLFNPFLEARAKILEKISLVFLSKRWHQQDILKLTDLYRHIRFWNSFMYWWFKARYFSSCQLDRFCKSSFYFESIWDHANAVLITNRLWLNLWKFPCHFWVLWNFLFSKVCWQGPASFAFKPQTNFHAHNLNTHWRWRWWDWIQDTF